MTKWLLLCIVSLFSFGAQAQLATEQICREELTAALKDHGINPAHVNVRSFQGYKGNSSDSAVAYQAWLRPGTCSRGYVVIQLNRLLQTATNLFSRWMQGRWLALLALLNFLDKELNNLDVAFSCIENKHKCLYPESMETFA